MSTSSPDPNLPDNLPTLNMSSKVGRGWRSVAVGQYIKSGDMLFAFFVDPPNWVISSFFTSDGFRNPGRQTYRRAISLRAKLSVTPLLIRKYWRKLKEDVTSIYLHIWS
jgi:hypothetical protein